MGKEVRIENFLQFRSRRGLAGRPFNLRVLHISSIGPQFIVPSKHRSQTGSLYLCFIDSKAELMTIWRPISM